MTLGSVQPGAEVWTVGKDATNPISIGALCIRDTATTPDSYKQATAAAALTGPFVVCVNKAAAAADTAFAAAFPNSFVTVKAQGVIEPGGPVYASATVAGSVAGAGTGDIAGRYVGHESEITGKIPATAAADGETNIVIRLGGVA